LLDISLSVVEDERRARGTDKSIGKLHEQRNIDAFDVQSELKYLVSVAQALVFEVLH
jgi:hypothetical protein